MNTQTITALIIVLTVFTSAAVFTESTEANVAPPNDECVDSIQVFNGVNPFNNFNATPQGPPSTPPFPNACTFGGGASKDVWFNYRATCTGNVEFSLCNNTDFDTVMEMFDTGSCNNLVGNELNCDDEGCGGSSVPSVFTQSVVAGKKYLIRVGSWLSADPGMGGVFRSSQYIGKRIDTVKYICRV